MSILGVQCLEGGEILVIQIDGLCQLIKEVASPPRSTGRVDSRFTIHFTTHFGDSQAKEE